MTRVMALALACGCLMSPVIPIGSGKSAREAQHDTLSELMPPALDTDRKWTGEVRSEKIRVWADDEYRAQNIHWQHTFGEQLDYANAVLVPVLGIQLVADYREWPRHAPGVTLEEDLAELARQDPGDGVLSVIGLTSSLGLVTSTFEQLGVASLPGRHLMLRGYADVEERKAFERAFPDVPVDERANVLETRRRHKTATVLLHELGHNLGAPHEDDSDTIMNAMYSLHATAFTEHSRQLMLARLGRGSGGAAQPQVHEPTRPLEITIVASGDLEVAGQPSNMMGVDVDMRDAFARSPHTEVIIKAARAAPHDMMIRLIDHAKSIGLDKFTIVTY